jgi:hypothetical protein
MASVTKTLMLNLTYAFKNDATFKAFYMKLFL